MTLKPGETINFVEQVDRWTAGQMYFATSSGRHYGPYGVKAEGYPSRILMKYLPTRAIEEGVSTSPMGDDCRRPKEGPQGRCLALHGFSYEWARIEGDVAWFRVCLVLVGLPSDSPKKAKHLGIEGISI